MGAALFDDPVVAAPVGKALFNDPPAAAPKSFTDHLGDFAGHTWDALTGTVSGTVNTVLHPIDTASAILRDAADEIGKGKAAYEKGDYDRAAEHFKYALPVAGPLLRQMRQETDAGDYGSALGDITGTALGGKLLARLPEVPGAAKAAAPIVTAAAKAGGKDIMVGGAKAAAGAALAKSGPLGEVGDVIAGVPIVKSGVQQMGRGARAAFQAGRDAYNAPPPAATPPPLATRTPIWTGPTGQPNAPVNLTPIPGQLPSGRVPGKPAIDTTTGEMLKGGASQGHFEAPAPAPPAAVAAPAAAPPPEPAAQITQIPPTEHPGAVDFAAKARAARDANVGPVADTLEKGGFTPELAKKLAPKDWLRLSKADGIGVNIPPKLAAAVIDELESRAAARDLAKAQQGTQAAADASTRAEATRRETMIAPSAAYAEALQRPGALAAAQALADEMNGVESPGKKAFAAKRARAAK